MKNTFEGRCTELSIGPHMVWGALIEEVHSETLARGILSDVP